MLPLSLNLCFMNYVVPIIFIFGLLWLTSMVRLTYCGLLYIILEIYGSQNR